MLRAFIFSFTGRGSFGNLISKHSTIKRTAMIEIAWCEMPRGMERQTSRSRSRLVFQAKSGAQRFKKEIVADAA
jgi:hypothetical protein